MKLEKQRLEDFKSEQKAAKTEIKAAKKEISASGKVIKKKNKLIAKAEREIGHWYYQERKKSTAEGRRKLDHFCTAISAAEQEIRDRSERKDICALRVQELKRDIRAKKKALKSGDVGTIELDV